MLPRAPFLLGVPRTRGRQTSGRCAFRVRAPALRRRAGRVLRSKSSANRKTMPPPFLPSSHCRPPGACGLSASRAHAVGKQRQLPLQAWSLTSPQRSAKRLVRDRPSVCCALTALPTPSSTSRHSSGRRALLLKLQQGRQHVPSEASEQASFSLRHPRPPK